MCEWGWGGDRIGLSLCLTISLKHPENDVPPPPPPQFLPLNDVHNYEQINYDLLGPPAAADAPPGSGDRVAFDRVAVTYKARDVWNETMVQAGLESWWLQSDAVSRAPVDATPAAAAAAATPAPELDAALVARAAVPVLSGPAGAVLGPAAVPSAAGQENTAPSDALPHVGTHQLAPGRPNGDAPPVCGGHAASGGPGLAAGSGAGLEAVTTHEEHLPIMRCKVDPAPDSLRLNVIAPLEAVPRRRTMDFPIKDTAARRATASKAEGAPGRDTRGEMKWDHSCG